MRKKEKRSRIEERIINLFLKQDQVIEIDEGDFVVRNNVMKGGENEFIVVMGFV